MYKAVGGTVYFVGAGPGAPDLLTIRARDLITQANLILYADSLVQEAVTQPIAQPDAVVQASSGMHLDEIMALMIDSAARGEVVVRLHSGDPSIYGAIHEQMTRLDAENVSYEIVPGIPAALAAAAVAKAELTVPGVVQTIILTRRAGRTPMPPGEDLPSLAAHRASIAIHLSVTRIRQVVDDLLAGGYPPETPAAVFYKLSWPDESHVTGTLADIAHRTKAAGYTRHALILVSPALDPHRQHTRSHLYDASYTHRFRRASVPTEPPVAESATDTPRDGRVVIAVTRAGGALAQQLAASLGADCTLPAKFAPDNHVDSYTGSVLAAVASRWQRYQALILVMPTGIAVRAIAPLLQSKTDDPAVVCLDEAGHSVIPLLGGHRAGANELAQTIAHYTGGHAAITTASDVQGLPALDLLGQERGWRLANANALTLVSAALVNGESIGVYVDPMLTGTKEWLDGQFEQADHVAFVGALPQLMSFSAGIIVTHRQLSADDYLPRQTLIYHPPVLVAGMGCKRGTSAEKLRDALISCLSENNLALASVSALATVDLKADEPGLIELAETLNIPLHIIAGESLRQLDPAGFSPSAAERFDLPGVAEPCAVVAAEGELIVLKRAFAKCTVAVAFNPMLGVSQ